MDRESKHKWRLLIRNWGLKRQVHSVQFLCHLILLWLLLRCHLKARGGYWTENPPPGCDIWERHSTWGTRQRVLTDQIQKRSRSTTTDAAPPSLPPADEPGRWLSGVNEKADSNATEKHFGESKNKEKEMAQRRFQGWSGGKRNCKWTKV